MRNKIIIDFDGKSFLETLVKKYKETNKRIMEISRDNKYTTGNLLDYEYFSKHYKLIAIDLSEQKRDRKCKSNKIN